MQHLSTATINYQNRSFPLYFREGNVDGDLNGMRQIFERNDYGFNEWHQGQRFNAYFAKNTELQKGLIIDAGANIGAAAVYFLETYKNSFLYCIEPEINNWNLLSKNTEKYTSKKLFHGGVSNQDGMLYLEDPDRSTMGFVTHQANRLGENLIAVPAISPQTIFTEMNAHVPMIFKIDIEGAEDYLFSGSTEWLDHFPLVIIELHDWMLPFSGSSRNFLRAVANHDFDFIYKNENVFLFNRKILG